MCGDDALWDRAAPGLQTGGGIAEAIMPQSPAHPHCDVSADALLPGKARRRALNLCYACAPGRSQRDSQTILRRPLIDRVVFVLPLVYDGGNHCRYTVEELISRKGESWLRKKSVIT